MKIRIPAHVAALAPYVPGKPIEEVERELGISGIVKLASNENPLGPSPLAVEAAREALADANRYPDGGGFYLRRKLASRLSIPEGGLVLGNGSTELVEILVRTFMEPGQSAVVSEGAFVMYRIATQAINGVPVAVPQTPDFRHDAAAMAGAVRPDTRIVFIANPNNPTGTYIRQEELGSLLDRVPADVLVVVDEAYREYMSEPDYPETIGLMSSHPNLVVLRTFSKIYGLAGIRIGYGLAARAVIAAMEKVRSPFNTSGLAQTAALAALDDHAHVERSRRTNREEREFLSDRFRELGVDFVPSSANFFLVHVGEEAVGVFERMLERGVIVRPMKAFGFPASVRISIGTREENERCLAALSGALDPKSPPSR